MIKAEFISIINEKKLVGATGFYVAVEARGGGNCKVYLEYRIPTGDCEHHLAYCESIVNGQELAEKLTRWLSEMTHKEDE